MSRLFAYCRVSTLDQTTENQVQEIIGSGFAIAPQRIVTETVSGSVAALERRDSLNCSTSWNRVMYWWSRSWIAWAATRWTYALLSNA